MPEETFETPQPTQPVTEPKTTNWSKIILAAVLGFALLAGAAYAGYWYGTQQASAPLNVAEQYHCQDDIDCVVKDGQCGPECLHKNQEARIVSDIVCEYRPWFKQERCECLDNRCTHITCEDLGLDFPECDQ